MLIYAQTLDRANKMVRYQFAYAVVAALTIAASTCFMLMCCCVPCAKLHKVPAADPVVAGSNAAPLA